VAPLTQAEVDALTDGTLVEVVWSGENGPHIYQLTHERGQTLVGPLPGKTGIKHSIKFVGETPPFTVIRMATPKPVIRQAIMPLSEPMICTRCKVKIGKGIKYYRTKNGPHHETCPTICPKCNGAGHADNAQFPCSTCYGSGSVITPKPVAAADVEKELLEELGFPDRPIKLEGVILEAVWLLLLRARRENRSLADTIYKWEHAVAREPVAVKTLNHIRNEYLRTVPQSQNDLRRTFLWWRDQAIRLQDENDKLRAEPANAPGAGHEHKWQQHIYSQCTECGVMFGKEEKS